VCASVLSEWGAEHARAHVPATSCVSPRPLATGFESVMPAVACTHRTARRWVCATHARKEGRYETSSVESKSMHDICATSAEALSHVQLLLPPNNMEATGLCCLATCDDTARSARDGASPTLKLRSYACPNVTASLWMCAQVRCMAVRCTHHKRSADRRGLAEVARFTRSSHGKRHQLIRAHMQCGAGPHPD
jgi:hypothetical protein